MTSPRPTRRVEVNEISPTLDPVRLTPAQVVDRSVADQVTAAFDRHETEIFGLLLAVTRDRELAADLTQEAFVRLIEELGRKRAPDNIGGWLYRTAVNLAISRARRASVARRFAPRLVRRDEPATPEGLAIERERSRLLNDALQRLPATDRVALVLAAQGLSGEEIATHLGMSHGALRTKLMRARARLRESLEHEEGGR